MNAVFSTVPAPTTFSARARSGVALVLVLAALALVSFIALAILTFVRSEDRGSRASADLVQVRMLSTLPEKLVISQIRRATGSATSTAGRGLGMDTTWTSQPGMIRIFGTTPETTTGTGTGPRAQLEEMFKLYSARQLTISDPTELAQELLRTQDWMNRPPEFVDLNEPVLVQPTRLPNAVQGTGKPHFVFPILDPFAQGLVDGFEVYTTGTAADGATVPQAPSGGFSTNISQPAMAMPVTWLYVLQDGSIIAPTGSQNGVASFGGNLAGSGTGNGNNQPGGGNPIVGRIAYWTDDDSCKLNINTATEPAPWDSPHTHTTTDEAYAASIPAKGEHYREPGHPAFTSLSPVLRNFSSSNTTATVSNAATTTVPMREPNDPILAGGDWWQHIKNWHSLLPRTFDTSANSEPGSGGGTRAASSDVQAKKGRLFASVDEFIFKKDATGVPTRVPNATLTSKDPDINATDLSKVRFFLTTHNRAPELNLFNRPKISLWPLMAQPTTRNNLDKEFARASTLGSDLYAFQRANDWLNSSSVGSSQAVGTDVGIARNQQLFGYLQTLTETAVPGFGGAFVNTTASATSPGKWTSTARDQLLVSMFDFLRWGVNAGTPFNQTITPLLPQYNYLPPVLAPTAQAGVNGVGGGSASPAILGLPNGGANTYESGSTTFTKGYGRFPTITEVAIVFTATGADNSTPPKVPGYANQTTAIQAFVVLQPFNPTPGVMPLAASISCNLVNLNGFKLNGAPLGFNPRVTTTFACPPGIAGTGGKPWGGDHTSFVGLSSQFLTLLGTQKRVAPTGSPYTVFTAVSAPFDITKLPPIPMPSGSTVKAGTAGTTLHFSGGPVTLEIVDVSGTIVQTLEMRFPATDIPVPLAPAGPSTLPTVAPITTTRFTVVPAPAPTQTAGPVRYRMPALIQPGDVVRSMVLAGANTNFAPASAANGLAYPGAVRGDARMLAGRVHVAAAPLPANPSQDYLIPHPQYFDGEKVVPMATPAQINVGRSAQSLRDGAYMASPTSINSQNYVSDPQIGFSSPPPATGGAPRPPPQTTAQTAGNLAVRGIAPLRPLTYPVNAAPATPIGTAGALNADNLPGDFDNGPGLVEDGAYLNMPDIGSTANQKSASSGASGGYFDRGGLFVEDDGLTFSPWRQISSAIAFGSLPTGIYGWAGDPGNATTPPSATPRPWQTLLFCPNPASRTTHAGIEPTFSTTTGGTRDHFGFLTPRDHLWLEYFWMPAVEPEGLSEGFSTEGKVNMNYQIMPFQWIKRATAMYGALHGVRLTAIPSQAVVNGSYKGIAKSSLEFRYAVDPDKTLAAFDDRFLNPTTGLTDVFRSPSEICEMFLIPKELPGHNYLSNSYPSLDPATVFQNHVHTTYQNALKWWEGPLPSDPTDGFEATGDNLREAPYAQLYPRLCTRSNVFTVHYRVQVLRKSRSTPPAQWVEGKDNVASEYRGETTIERYLDPTTTKVPDFVAAKRVTEAVDDYYQYRIVRRKQFAP